MRKGFLTVPVLFGEAVETMEAGDAYLAITAPWAYMGFPLELLGFIGNAVEALAVRIINNKESVESVPLFRFINTLLK